MLLRQKSRIWPQVEPDPSNLKCTTYQSIRYHDSSTRTHFVLTSFHFILSGYFKNQEQKLSKSSSREAENQTQLQVQPNSSRYSQDFRHVFLLFAANVYRFPPAKKVNSGDGDGFLSCFFLRTNSNSVSWWWCFLPSIDSSTGCLRSLISLV